MPLKPYTIAFAVVALITGHAHAQGGWGALGGIGEAMQRQAEVDAQLEAQKQLIELQHRREMERMRYQYEMEQRQRQQAARQVQSSRPQIHPEELERRRREVDSIHPGWRELVRTASYQNWVNNAPPEMKRRATSSEVGEFAYALTAFKREMNIGP